MAESAFAVNVPEAEPYVEHIRARFDPSYALGAPAHITILYPFASPTEISHTVCEKIAAALSAIRPFTFSLAKFGRFPNLLYLRPDPAEPLIEITKGLSKQFPSWPPYSGLHATIVPHLTVAYGDNTLLSAIEGELSRSLPKEGIRAKCDRLVLIENSTGLWKLMRVLPLAPAAG